MAEIVRLERKKSLPERLQEHPKLWARVEQLLDLVEGNGEGIVKAAEAEERVGEHLQQLGQESLQAWAEERHACQARYWERRAGVTRKEKKDSTGRRATGGSKS